MITKEQKHQITNKMLKAGGTLDTILLEIDAEVFTMQALESACLHGNLENVRYLINKGVDPKCGFNKDEVERGYMIVGPGNREVLVNEFNHVHIPFDNAIQSGNIDLVKFMRDGGYFSEGNLDRATSTAVLYGHLDLVKYFVKTGVNFHYNNEDALQIACEEGRTDIIQYLIENGADIHASANFLLNAINGKHYRIAHFLMDHGVDLVWPIRKSDAMGMLKVIYYLTRQFIKRYPSRVKEIEEYLNDYQKKKYAYLLASGEFNLI